MADEEPGVETLATVGKPVRDGRKWPFDANERVRAAIRRYSKPMAHLGAKDADEDVPEPKPEPTSAVAADVQQVRAELADAGRAARRWLVRLRWARLIIVALVQVAIAIVAWRIWVWRGRPRLKPGRWES